MDISRLINHPVLMDHNTLYELRALVALYPCYQTARVLMLRNLYLLHDPSFGEELRRAAIYITDRTTLFKLVEEEHYKLTPPQTETDDDSTTDTEKNTHSRSVTLIDNFLKATSAKTVGSAADEDNTERQAREAPTHETIGESDDCYTVAMAKIYIRQGRYEKAIDIIKHLNLINPQKNIYFADQIRFLRKMQVNSEARGQHDINVKK